MNYSVKEYVKCEASKINAVEILLTEINQNELTCLRSNERRPCVDSDK